MDKVTEGNKIGKLTKTKLNFNVFKSYIKIKNMKTKILCLVTFFVMAGLLLSCTKNKIEGPTLENLKKSLNREIYATAAYKAYKIQAENEGLKNVAKLFKALAIAENIHAKIYFNLLKSQNEKLQIVKPEIKVDFTKYNLQNAIKQELNEIENIYPAMVLEAKNSNQEKALVPFYHTWKAERSHKYLLDFIYDKFVTIPPQKTDKLQVTQPSNEDLIDLDVNYLSKTYYVCPEDGIIYDNLVVPNSCDSCSTPKCNFIKID